MSEPDPFKINEDVIDLWRCYIIKRDMAKEMEAENARLKADVERLKAKQTDIDRVQAQSDFYRSKLINGTEYTANVQLIDQVKHLEAQIERLTKAGDAIYQSFDQFGQVDAMTLKKWQTAKDGKDAQ